MNPAILNNKESKMLYIPMSSFIDRTKIINNTRYSVTYTPAEEQEQNRYLTWLFDHEER